MSITTAFDNRSKYHQIASDLSERIRRGDYAPGELLPSLAELGARYAVSQITVRQAVRLLVEQGLARTVPGKGTFAASRSARDGQPVAHRVGVLLPTVPCWSALYPPLCEELHALGHDILIKPLPVTTDFAAEPERALFELEALRSSCGSGLIMYGDRTLVEAFLRQRRPEEVGVCLENSNGIPPTVPVVTTDNFGGTFAVTRHLLALGHTRIAYLDEPLLWDPNAPRMRPGTTHEQRFAGYRAALRAAGLSPCMPRDLLSALQRHREPDPEELARLIQRPEQPTAIVCFNDYRAREAYECLTAAGVSVPGEISLTGYDNDSETVSEGWLTSLDQNGPEIARQLVRMLHGERERLESRRHGPTPMILVPPILHIRDSVAPPPA